MVLNSAMLPNQLCCAGLSSQAQVEGMCGNKLIKLWPLLRQQPSPTLSAMLKMPVRLYSSFAPVFGEELCFDFLCFAFIMLGTFHSPQPSETA